jgi:hypothetical protein
MFLRLRSVCEEVPGASDFAITFFPWILIFEFRTTSR